MDGESAGGSGCDEVSGPRGALIFRGRNSPPCFGAQLIGAPPKAAVGFAFTDNGRIVGVLDAALALMTSVAGVSLSPLRSPVSASAAGSADPSQIPRNALERAVATREAMLASSPWYSGLCFSSALQSEVLP